MPAATYASINSINNSHVTAGLPKSTFSLYVTAAIYACCYVCMAQSTTVT